MRYRELGKTGLRVSELGYGAWGIGGAGWVGAENDESLRALERAIELGVNFIDTARGYGESERLVGEVVRRHPGRELYVATKVPPKNGTFPAPRGLDPAQTFPGDHIRSNIEESLRVSGLEAFDVFQFHVWSDEWIGLLGGGPGAGEAAPRFPILRASRGEHPKTHWNAGWR